MNVKQLKDELSKFPDNKEVYVSNDLFTDFSFPIKNVVESHVLDEDEPSIIVIES